MKDLKKELCTVNSKESFVRYLTVLSQENNHLWENNTLDSYLSSMKDYAENVDGFYKNLNNPDFDNIFNEIKESYDTSNTEDILSSIPPIAWRVFADLLYGAREYE